MTNARSGSWILETVRWRDRRVRILDQTRLPADEIYLELSTVDQVIAAIRSLGVRGAPAIGVAGAMAVSLAAEAIPDGPDFLDRLRAECERIERARPTAVNLRWACRRALARAEVVFAHGVDVTARTGEEAGTGDARGRGSRIGSGEASAAAAGDASRVRRALREESERILQEDLDLSSAMSRHGAALLPAEGHVVTHCNTGGLATAGGGTALGAVLEAHRQGKRLVVHVDETRPLLQGARLTAWELERAGIPYEIQCDGAAAWLMRSRRIDAVLVGADRVAANGDTANKLGTLSLALAARTFAVPFYVVAPGSSFDLSLPDGGAIPIEERDPAEVLAWGGHPTAPEGARAWNPAFDVTPAAYVTAWVTERGVLRPPFSSANETDA